LSEIYILTVGYPSINSKSNEKLIQHPLTNDKLGNSIIKESINFYDYHIIMIKDISVLITFPECLKEIGNYRGVLAFSFFPLCCYKKYDLTQATTLSEKFRMEEYNNASENFYISYYSKVLLPYIDSQLFEGKNIEFRKGHWLGEIFNNYKEYFKYKGSFTPGENLKGIIALEELSKKISKKSVSFIKIFAPFAFAPGGLIVGAIVKITNSTLILHPEPLFSNEKLLAKFLRDFLDGIETNLLGVKYMEPPKPRWVDYLFIKEKKKIIEEAMKIYDKSLKEIERFTFLENLYWQTGDELVNAIEFAFKELGFHVENISHERKSGDLIVQHNESQFIIEIKGKEGPADKSDISNFIANNLNKNLIFIVNHYRLDDPKERNNKPDIYIPYTPSAIETIKDNLNNKTIKSFYPITTIELAELVLKKLTPKEVLENLEKISYTRLLKS
jgi:hypothetical protein